ncbi:hypothetical protein HU200_010115 [Digitaria exilis]|uniref:Uncharacterized protein n=1 Tax=Digitaria exilis TaxID=1010633 RepID=A0A835KNS1_9POAL|nr:hypothetical protein HU200_010115 [Digitaria exilis]
MGSHILLIGLVLVACTLHVAYAKTATTSGNLTAATTGTAYEILEKNNLPRGLLPNGVQSYTLNPEGKFEVTLPSQCDFPLTFGGQDFKFRFASTVGGVIKSGSIHEIYGVRVQIKFGWLGLRQVDRAGDQLNLQVQQFAQSFPVSAFAPSSPSELVVTGALISQHCMHSCARLQSTVPLTPAAFTLYLLVLVARHISMPATTTVPCMPLHAIALPARAALSRTRPHPPPDYKKPTPIEQSTAPPSPPSARRRRPAPLLVSLLALISRSSVRGFFHVRRKVVPHDWFHGEHLRALLYLPHAAPLSLPPAQSPLRAPRTQARNNGRPWVLSRAALPWRTQPAGETNISLSNGVIEEENEAGTTMRKDPHRGHRWL